MTGALLRWRMLPQMSLWAASRLTLMVTVSFLMGWAVVTAFVLALVPDAAFSAAAWPVLALALAGIVAVLLCARPGWPNGFTMLHVLGLTALDCGAAALALWLLMPGEIGFGTLLPAFLLALGAGLLSGAPGGVGAFEMVLLALLPGGAEEGILAAVLAWRLIQYVIPALIGAAVALRAPVRAAAPQIPSPPWPVEGPEAGLLRQGHLFPLALGRTALAAGRTRHALIALHGPGGRQGAAASLHELRGLAQAEARVPSA
ncbi:MAG: hypothetical protein HC844_21590 [Tabrizicola sp.]|nr:hypothetical protein [Tabrizicola sp.]